MDMHGVRYFFEHRILPTWFFNEKERFVALLIKDKSILYRLIDNLFTKRNIPNPYTEDDFSIEHSKITDEVMMLKLNFPEPEEEPFCYCCYVFFDIKFEKISYFCIEKGDNYCQNTPFLCSWSEDGKHLNYGHCTFENDDDFFKCAEIHMKKMYGSNENNAENS